MKKINILWLYEDLMDLYGDRGNLSIIKYVLDKANKKYEIESKSLDEDIDFKKYQIVYIGPGKDTNLLVAYNHLKKYKNDINKAIEKNTTFLAFGNSCLLFGKEIIDLKGNKQKMLDIFDVSASFTNKVFIDDVVCEAEFINSQIYGFINTTTAFKYDDSNYLFKIKKANNYKEDYEGIHYKNFYASFALGPLLVKNPDLLKYILKDYIDDNVDLGIFEKAHEKTIKEL